MKVYSEYMVEIPSNTEDPSLLILKSYADIFYAAYDNNFSQDKIDIITKVIMNNIRKLSDIEESMCFGRRETDSEVVLFIFNHKPDGILRNVSKDKNGFYIEVED